MSDNDHSSYPPASLLEQFGPRSQPRYARDKQGNIMRDARGAPLPEVGIGDAIYQLFEMLILAFTDPEQYEFKKQVYGFEDFNWENILGPAVERGRETYSGGAPLDEALRESLREMSQNGAGNLLAVIRKIEANDNYNIANGGRPVNFTNMTVNEVIAWQRQDERTNGNLSAAAGAYQIIRPTLESLKREMNLTGNERFDEAMQDRMAHVLLRRRGLDSFLEGRMSAEEFMFNLSQEWAAIPKDGSGLSFYHGDGVNKAASSKNILGAIENLRDTHRNAVNPAAAEDASSTTEAYAQNARSFENPASRANPGVNPVPATTPAPESPA